MKLFTQHWLLCSLLIPLVLGITFVWSPAWAAVATGATEGAELSKALLLSERPAAVGDLEINQPWLYTMMVSALFKTFGTSAGIARLFTLISAATMLVALGWMLHHVVGGLRLLLVGIFCFSVKGMLMLSMSAQPGLPAISFAILATAIIYKPVHPPGWKRLLLSGVLLACATQITFMALTVLPAFVVFVFRQWEWRSACKYLRFWGIGLVMATLIIMVLSPNVNFRHLLNSPTGPIENQPQFHLNTLFFNPGLMLAAGFGIFQLAKRKYPAPLLFASAWLATVTILAWVWGYWPESEMAQFYIPMAMLGTAGFAAAFSSVLSVFQAGPVSAQPLQNSVRQIDTHNELNMLAAVTIFAFWVGFTVPDFVAELKQLHRLPAVKDNELCLSIKENAKSTKWCYTRFAEYAFANHVLIPPELIGLTQLDGKYGQTNTSLLKMVKKNQPEQLLLAANIELRDQEWKTWTTNHYILVDQDGEKELWVSRSLHPQNIQPSNDILRKLGL